MVDKFEDGKPAEEYFDEKAALEELNSLPIEDDTETAKVPEGQPLENVVQMIEKSAKKKPDPPQKKVVPPPEPVVETPPTIVTPEPTPLPEPIVTEQPAPQEVPVEEPKPTFYSGIDDFIQKQSEQIEIEYANQGKLASDQFKKAAYQNLVAVVTGQVRIVPVEQPQPPSEIIQEKIVNNRVEDIRRIDEALKDPAFAASRKALLKKKCDLLGVDFCDELVPEQKPIQQDPPVNPQLANPKKRRLSPKIYFSILALAGLVVAAIYLLINALA